MLGLFVATAATLRFAQDFFLPLVLAGLLSFLLWQADDAEFAARRDRLGKAGADETYPDLRRAAVGLAEFAACTPPPAADATPPPPA